MKGIKNEVLVIGDRELDQVKMNLYSDEKTFLVELEGKTIQSWEDYISIIQDKFKFPTKCFDSVDRYLDLIRDLEWLKKDRFVLIIRNYSFFLKQNPKLRNEIISEFTEIILPFWQEEVEEVIIGGRAKSFLVYLVE